MAVTADKTEDEIVQLIGAVIALGDASEQPPRPDLSGGVLAARRWVWANHPESS